MVIFKKNEKERFTSALETLFRGVVTGKGNHVIVTATEAFRDAEEKASLFAKSIGQDRLDILQGNIEKVYGNWIHRFMVNNKISPIEQLFMLEKMRMANYMALICTWRTCLDEEADKK